MKKPSTTALAGGIIAGLLLAGAGGWLALDHKAPTPAKQVNFPFTSPLQGQGGMSIDQYARCYKMQPLCTLPPGRSKAENDEAERKWRAKYPDKAAERDRVLQWQDQNRYLLYPKGDPRGLPQNPPRVVPRPAGDWRTS